GRYASGLHGISPEGGKWYSTSNHCAASGGSSRYNRRMEIRQLRYFTCVVEAGSMGKAARELGVVTSALSQQISRLESELATRLLQRTGTGVVPTDAGLAFFRQAQLALRHVDEA